MPHKKKKSRSREGMKDVAALIAVPFGLFGGGLLRGTLTGSTGVVVASPAGFASENGVAKRRVLKRKKRNKKRRLY